MFKKTRKLNPPPKPITMDQVLADLETFAVPKSDIVPSTRFVTPNEPDYEKEWWKLFETFLHDVDRLKDLQKQLDSTKSDLLDRRRDISKAIAKLEKQMETQKRFLDEIPDL